MRCLPWGCKWCGGDLQQAAGNESAQNRRAIHQSLLGAHVERIWFTYRGTAHTDYTHFGAVRILRGANMGHLSQIV